MLSLFNIDSTVVDDVESHILTLFNAPDFASHPRYLAEIGCGDGSTLRRMHEAIRTRSLRGRSLEQFPLILIGVERDRAALEDAGITLAGVPHVLLQVEGDDPHHIHAALREQGIDPDSVLMLGSFLRDALLPAGRAAQVPMPTAVDQQWAAHLQAWADGLGPHGLLVVQSHCVQAQHGHGAPLVVDALHAVSGQGLIDAESFLVLAARAGLFAAIQPLRYPKSQAPCQVTVSHLHKRPYLVRHARPDDMPALLALEQRCWPVFLQTAVDSLQQRIAVYPQGQFVLELEGQVAGVIYSQRIVSQESLQDATSDTVFAQHCADGPMVQLLAVNILPELQERNFGDDLLEFMLQRCSVMQGVEAVVAISLCKDFHRQSEIALGDYIHQRTALGHLIDPILRFHERHGARITGIAAGYRPCDLRNQGNGVWVHYDIHRRSRNELKINPPTSEQDRRAGERQEEAVLAAPVTTLAHIDAFLENAIRDCLGAYKSHAYARDLPLMEMGMNSADLLTLGEQIQSHYRLRIESTFFFAYKTPERMGQALFTRLGGAAPIEAPAAVPQGPAQDGDIAIIGAACRLPGGIDSPAALWAFLKAGGDAITDLPQGRWSWSTGFDVGQFPGITRGGFLNDIARFDAAFFRLSPREAEMMDPQQRILLELSWQALEDAGYSRADLAQSQTGVFIGASGSDYHTLLEQQQVAVQAHSGLGNSMAILANRLSYFYDWQGPSLCIDTACSSSLVAVYEAVEALRHGKCEQALVGGIHIMCHPENSLAYYQAGMLAPDGLCKPFDQSANGYVRAEGGIVMLLKPLCAAQRDGDRIAAVIKGVACNHGGQASGLTVPNPQQQAKLLQLAWRDAGVNPATISYIEAHGTGTKLGDPIEVLGLQEAIGSVAVPALHRCGLGSIKSNLGHLEAAAGLAGLLKVMLSMQNRQLPASLHFDGLNPAIALDDRFTIVDRQQDWLAEENEPRRAGVSSFGSGGTNAHVVIEEYPQLTSAQARPAGPVMIVLSAKTQDRLDERARQLLTFIVDNDGIELVDLAYTLQVGREAMEERLGLISSCMPKLREKLQQYLQGQQDIAHLYRGRARQNTHSPEALTDNAALQEKLHQWAERKKFNKLLKHWCKGVALEWNQFYGQNKPQRISAPTYPFAGERFWIETRVAQKSAPAIEQRLAPAAQRSRRFLQKQWLVQPATAIPRSFKKIAILTTDETQPLASALAELLPRSQVLMLSDLSSETQSAESLPVSDSIYDAIIDLAGCGASRNESLVWLSWLQQQLRHRCDEGILVLGISQGLESFQNSHVNLTGASRAALYRLLNSEYHQVQSRHVDMDVASNTRDIAQNIIAELGIEDAAAEICYRGEQRYRASLTELTGTPPSSDLSWRFAEDEVLLITGGTRGLGLLCARHFVQHYQVKRLVLTGRETLPARAQWPELAKRNDATGIKLRALLALEEQGVQIRALSLDLCDAAAVNLALQDIGPIGGIVHCAGLSDHENPAFIHKPIAGIAQVLAPKITGLDVLLQHLRGQPLRFGILFSSVSAIIPSLGAGQSDYAMANAYMDYLAGAAVHAFPLLSIQWPSWKESGMGEVKNRAYVRTGLLAHSDEEGFALLDHVLAHQFGPVVLPAVVDPSIWAPERLMEQQQGTPNTAAPRPLMLPQTVLDWLRELFSAELKIPAQHFDGDTAFADYGVDSILLAQLLRKISRKIDSDLDPSLLFEYSTLQTLAAYLGGNHAQAWAMQDAALPVTPVRAAIAISPQASIVKQIEGTGANDIAVVGLSCRFPGASDSEAYWQLLQEGRSAITEVAEGRWPNPQHFFAGMLDNVTDFDPAFFLIKPEDARAMDPQALLVLEESLKLFHHAGYGVADVKGRPIGVYLGARSKHQPSNQDFADAQNPVITTGQNYLAANVSQFFDLHGPSLVVDTACSSALVGMSLAVQALRDGEIEAAMVGGVSVLGDDSMHQLFARRQLLSPDAAFHVFDRRAAGVVLAEGVGMVLLKTVAQAQRDGDQIYAVLKAIAINNNGRTAGPATPNLQAQKEVMHSALRKSGYAPEDIGYVEANASGSEITDLLELKAIASVYRSASQTACAVGSVKPNIGHPLCAEGIAGFIKLVLMLHRRQWVPCLSGQQGMSHFDFAASPFQFCRQALPWETARKAALNCFADGGTNVHLILAGGENDVLAVRRPLPLPLLKRVNVHAGEAPTAGRNWWSRQAPSGTIMLDIDHPILKNHKAYGQALLPGLAYIDLLYQIFRERGYACQELELRNLSIYQPLAVGQDFGVQLTVSAVEVMDGTWQGWRVSVDGQDMRGGVLASDSKHYISADMHRSVRAEFSETLDMAMVRAQATHVQDLQSVYAQCRANELVHTEFMRAEGKVYATADAIVIEIALPAAGKTAAGEFLFHPTLIDSSAIGSEQICSVAADGQVSLFLPLHYASFTAGAAFQDACITRIARNSLRRKNELVTMTMEFFDASGRKIAELINFANKLVRNAGLINPQRQAAASDAIQAVKSVAIALPERTNMLTTTVVASPDADSVQKIEAVLKQIIGAKLSGGAAIDVNAGYYEMGLNSSMLLGVVIELEQALAISLNPTLLFEYTTIHELATHLASTSPAAATEVSPAPLSAPAAAPQIIDRATPLATQAGPDRSEQQDDIAIIGIAGRYPGAANIAQFWTNLQAGKNCVSEIPADRWDWRELQNLKSPSGKPLSRWGGFIDQHDCFDPLFFGISPREAETMDPQERLFLESCWEAIEDAGYTPKTLVPPRGPNRRRDVGVFVGVMHNDYGFVGAEAATQGEKFPLSINYAPIANRVSYVCDFHGPSMAVDTVCSSSLTAVHLALTSLQQGESLVALAGGVNLSLHTSKYLTYGLMDMHASDGICHTFGEGGDGYVSGEGVGAVLLKPLRHALRDGDHVYAVIKGSAINHGGHASGFTVPNPVSQADVITRCLENSRIDPRTLSYVEAHGTGTSLGDPIEIHGLDKAFRTYTQDPQFCAIGSVKSNIGHAESAAGISGLSKVILQLHHKTLVPSLHAETLNPHIDFTASPFYVQQKSEPWQAPIIGEVSYPRRAGLSSFGAYGSNAHLIVEEFVDGRTALSSAGPVMIVLSAKNPERLRVYAERLLAFLREHQETNLAGLAYTLQVGREAWDDRLGLIAASVEELQDKLQHYLDGQTGILQLYQGQIKRNKESLAVFAVDEDLQRATEVWIEKGKFDRLLDLWVKGLVIDWTKLYGVVRPMRISAPTYPFAKERYWVASDTHGAESTGSLRLHPLLHQNTSTFDEQRYASSFTGAEFFLSDHVVQGHKVLPGVAYLEMAHAAVRRALGENADPFSLQLNHILWIRPVVVEQLADVKIALYSDSQGQIAFEISSDGKAGKPLLYCQGTAMPLTMTAHASEPGLTELQARFTQARFTPEQCYAAFNAMGLQYGPAHSAIARLYNSETQPGLLARLSLPDRVAATLAHYTLHPSLLDGALQAAIAMVCLPAGRDARLALPFSLDCIDILGPCTATMWAWVRPGMGAADIDIALFNDAGTLCVRMTGFQTRVVNADSVTSSKDTSVTLAVQLTWIAQELSDAPSADMAPRHVMLCGLTEGLEALASHLPDCVIETDAGRTYQSMAISLFESIQAQLRSPDAAPILYQIVVPEHSDGRLFAGLAALLQTAHQENSRICGQLIVLGEMPDVALLARILIENAQHPDLPRIRYAEGRRSIARWREIPDTALTRSWRDDGVYLITGGAGGLGAIFARDILQHTGQARVILAGRRPLEKLAADQQALLKLDRLHYRSVDVCDGEVVRSLISEIEHEFGQLNGVLHSAGLIRDNFIINKTAAEFEAVLAPKVDGMLLLDQATQHLALDFLILFSSMAGSLGNAGQADYAAANGFMDAFAGWRNEQVRLGRRHGQSLAIGWPLWQDGGMMVDAAMRTLLKTSFGIVPMPTEEGIGAFHRVLHSGAGAHAMVLRGNLPRMKHVLGMAAMAGSGVSELQKVVNEAVDPGALAQQVLQALKGSVASLLKLKVDDVDPECELSEFGFDSISLTELANRLNEQFDLALIPTLFFEYPTLNGLAAHLSRAHQALFAKRFQSPAIGAATIAVEVGPSAEIPVRARRMRFVSQSASAQAEREPIAIIGISGRFPQAEDIAAFWNNLQAGKDCISEIPASRWDWRALWGDPAQEANKSNIKWGGFIDGVDEFDPLFFGISPREALLMDPQQRLLMQYVWLAIEDAGYSPQSLSGSRTALFIGTGTSGYDSRISAAGIAVDGYSATGLWPSVGPNRMSYFLNLHGPSEPIETACSSSLVAIYRAVQCIQDGECEQAIVGGINTLVTPRDHISFNKAGMLCEDGRCKTFSGAANGYVRGEGVGMLMLKPLSVAEVAGDHIYGVIRGAAQNHGGRANSLTAPNPHAQAEVIRMAYQKAGVDISSVSYIEAHGTGTPLGDPIEINGLKLAFAELGNGAAVEHPWCALGAVKTHIGHLELAAGMAGLIKILLQMQHQTLIGNLHGGEQNPYIDLKDSPFYLVRENHAWTARADAQGNPLPRRAGISSFGFGGTNAHVVIEEYLGKSHAAASQTGPVLIVLSAKNQERLQDYARKLLCFARENTATNLVDLAYTLQVGREAMDHRLAMLVATNHELQEKLQGYLEGEQDIENLHRGQVRRGKDSVVTFELDEELQEAIAKWMARGKFNKLLDLWVKGLALDWSGLYGAATPQRISAPTYPFARERYWVDVPAVQTVPALVPGAPVAVPLRSPRFLQKQWLLHPARWSAGSYQSLAILAGATTDTLAQALSAILPNSQIVRIGEAPVAPQTGFDSVVDLVGCGSTAEEDCGRLDWLQEQLRDLPAGGIRLLGLTQGLESFLNPQVRLAGAACAALYRLLSAEYSNVRSRHVDLDPAAQHDDIAHIILAELGQDEALAEVCYRDGLRYRATLAEMAAGAAGTGTELEFSADQVLLVSGGTRGLGILCASHFVDRYKVRRLVLLGREPLPARPDWPACAERQDATGAKIRAFQTLEAQGVEVRALALDLGDEGAVKSCISEIAASFGPIAGLLHCAGRIDTDNPAFIHKPIADMQAVLAPKTVGIQALLKQLQAQHQPLRFAVLFSSVSATVPALGAGQSDYAMANGYLDYLAGAGGYSFPMFSIQWPSWRESGMGEVKGRAYARTGLLTHSDAEGLALLDQILTLSLGPVVLPAMVDLRDWTPSQLMDQRPAAPAQPSLPAAPVQTMAASANQASAPLAHAIQAWLLALLSDALKIRPQDLDADTPFPEYGVDSILLAQVLKKVNKKIGAELDPSILYENSTLTTLSEFLLRTQTAGLALAFAARDQTSQLAHAAPEPASLLTPPAQADASIPSPIEPAIAYPSIAKPAADDDMVVVGLSCRLPGADDLQTFWDLLQNGRTAIAEVPRERWPNPQHFHAGLISNVHHFDAAFFLIRPEDARAMDPQALLLLEESLKLFHHAGYNPAEMKGRRTGVYIGARSGHRPAPAELAQTQNPILATGQNYLATNISQFFDLRGPSLVVDTACSSALVGMNLAVQALRDGEIESAVVGGVSLLANDSSHEVFKQRKALNPGAAFHAFDQRAAGVVLGEGAGLVMLKTRRQALQDGDTIYAVLKAIAINNDGRTAGPATPNILAQKEVMQRALARSGCAPREIGYIEANASGSEVTDLLELKAISAVYRSDDSTPCVLGSVKPNIGHPLCAEGIASFIKLVLMLHAQKWVPCLSGQQAMTHFDLVASPFIFCRETQPWPEGKRLAALNCFADGGTNAHLVLAAWDQTEGQPPVRHPLTPPALNPTDVRVLSAPGPTADEKKNTGQTASRWGRRNVKQPALAS